MCKIVEKGCSIRCISYLNESSESQITKAHLYIKQAKEGSSSRINLKAMKKKMMWWKKSDSSSRSREQTYEDGSKESSVI